MRFIKFSSACIPKKRGRSLSEGSVTKVQESGISICTQERASDGKTLYYKHGNKPASKKAKALKEKIKKNTRSKKEVRAGYVGDIAIKDLAVDPSRFQYKLSFSESGEVGSLEGVQKFDQNLAGLILAWRDDKDGKIYVVNGHNRFSLAKRLGVEKMAVRLMDVASEKEARATGALANIAEGRGTKLDAAKFFRDTQITPEDLKAKGIPFRDSHANDGLALSRLENMLFGMVIDGIIPIKQGVIIGGAGFSDQQQFKLYELIKKEEKKGRYITDDLLKEMVDLVKSSNVTQKVSEDLFGEFEEEEDNIFDKLSLQSTIGRRLARENRIFGTVGKDKTAKELGKAGNVIDVEQSAIRAKQAKESLQLFDSLKNAKGRVSDILNDAADRMKRTESRKEKERIQDEVYERILSELPKQAGFKN